MKKYRVTLSFVVLSIFIIGFAVFQQNKTATHQQSVDTQASIKKGTQKITYPTFIGEEGLLDASEAQALVRNINYSLKEMKKEVAVREEVLEVEELDEMDEETTEAEELDTNDKEIANESQQSEDTNQVEKQVASSKKEQIQTENNPDSSETKEEKQPVVIPPSNLVITDYFLPNSNSTERTNPISHVVLHFASNALNKPDNPYLIEDTYNIFKNAGVSANYVIDRNGKIYRFVPENRVAYHAGPGQLSGFPEYTDRLNHHSVGIELLGIGTREEMIPMITAERFDLIDSSLYGFTEAQYQALNTLLNDILSRNPAIQKNRNHIVGHDEYAPDKTDPGRLFNWSKIGL